MKWNLVKDVLPKEPIRNKKGVIKLKQYLVLVESKVGKNKRFEVRHYFDKSFIGDYKFCDVIAWTEIRRPKNIK
jgi:hypothetical protein